MYLLGNVPVDARQLEDLIRHAMESGELDDPVAESPRGADCLSMARLDVTGSGGLPLAESERRHVAGCGLCRGRYSAFGGSDLAARRVRAEARGRRLMRQWSGPAAAAIAAGLLLAFGVLRGVETKTEAVRRVAALAPVDFRGIPVSVCHEPGQAIEGARRIDHFPATAEEPCLIVAVFRAWDETCQCLLWQLHEWDDEGKTRAQLDPEGPLDIAWNVTNDPPVEQLLVLASSRRPSDLPGYRDDAVELLECLNSKEPPAAAQGDLSEYASAVSSCLPSSVTLVQQTFFVE